MCRFFLIITQHYPSFGKYVYEGLSKELKNLARAKKLMFWSCFVLKGKEYVCIVRLHEAIENETELAKVSEVYQN